MINIPTNDEKVLCNIEHNNMIELTNKILKKINKGGIKNESAYNE